MESKVMRKPIRLKRRESILLFLIQNLSVDLKQSHERGTTTMRTESDKTLLAPRIRRKTSGKTGNGAIHGILLAEVTTQ